MSGKSYWVYILASKRNGTLYVGVTNSLLKRVWQHKKGESSFTSRYQVHCLVYFEEFRDPDTAIAREKQLKAGSRSKKIELIEKENPAWVDLGRDWYESDGSVDSFS